LQKFDTATGKFVDSAITESGGNATVAGTITAAGVLGIRSQDIPSTLDNKTLANPTFTGTVAGITNSALPSTLSNKTLDSPTITNPTFSSPPTLPTGTSVNGNASITGALSAYSLTVNGVPITTSVTASGGASNPGATIIEANNAGTNPTATVSLRHNGLVKLQADGGGVDLVGGLKGYTTATLPSSSAAGRLAIVTDGRRGLYVSTGSEWLPYQGDVDARWFGVKGGDAANDTTAINTLLAVSSRDGMRILLPEGQIDLATWLNGSAKNITFVGVRGKTRFVPMNPLTSPMFNTSEGRYDGWTFENVIFDARFRQTTGNQQIALNLVEAQNLTFRNCVFRGFAYPVSAQHARNVKFQYCEIYGTDEGVMASGVSNPAANPNAAYGSAVQIGEGTTGFELDHCYLHFVAGGFGSNSSANTPATNTSVTNSVFRNDWWNAPFYVMKFTPTTYTPLGTMTFAAGGFDAAATGQTDYMPITIPIQITTGTAFTRVYLTEVDAASWTGVQVGDSIETSDGRRAEISAIPSSTRVHIRQWEAISTYEPTTPPALATSFRVMRYYAQRVARTPGATNTSLTFVAHPVNPLSGRSIEDDGLSGSVTSSEVRVLAPNGYGGVHGAYFDNLLVQGNTVRGGLFDQVSIFYSKGVRVVNNWIGLGQDEGVTITLCDPTVVANNTFENQAASSVAAWSHRTSVTGNTSNGWAIINSALGAIDSRGEYSTVIGNTGKAQGGAVASKYHISLYASQLGSVIAHNPDDARTSSIYMNDAITGPVEVFGARSITGSNAASARQTSVNPHYMAAPAATATATLGNSPKVHFVTTWWDAAASLSRSEQMSMDAKRTGGLANGAHVMTFYDVNNNYSLSLAPGGAASVGYIFADVSRGQLHVRPILATTVGQRIQAAASQTADLFQAFDSAGAVKYFALDSKGRPVTGGTTPTFAAGTGAGTTPTITISGNDQRGLITITTGTTPTASADVATITFANTWGAVPKVMLTPAGANAAALTAAGAVYVDSANTTGTLFKLSVGSTALAASTVYKFYYDVSP
jgi:hypothetical protein